MSSVWKTKLFSLNIKMTNSHSDFHRKLNPAPVHMQYCSYMIYRLKCMCERVFLSGVIVLCVNYLHRMAEELLMPKPPGYFLIRVSESRIGYTLSYRWVFAVIGGAVFYTYDHTLSSALFTLLNVFSLTPSAADRCRHFMIDLLVDGQYIIIGENRYHRCLQDLVDFHRRTPIMPYTEVLTVACGQVRKITILPAYRNVNWTIIVFIISLCGL